MDEQPLRKSLILQIGQATTVLPAGFALLSLIAAAWDWLSSFGSENGARLIEPLEALQHIFTVIFVRLGAALHYSGESISLIVSTVGAGVLFHSFYSSFLKRRSSQGGSSTDPRNSEDKRGDAVKWQPSPFMIGSLKFVRDIATNAIGGAIVLAIGYFFLHQTS